MRMLSITFGTLALLATSSAFADPASHVIGNDDEPVSRATDAVAGGRMEDSEVLTLAFAPRGSRPAGDMGTIGDDDQPFSRATAQN